LQGNVSNPLTTVTPGTDILFAASMAQFAAYARGKLTLTARVNAPISGVLLNASRMAFAGLLQEIKQTQKESMMPEIFFKTI
jgi:hypothetical protein